MRQDRRGSVLAATHPTRVIAGLRYNPRAASVYSDDMNEPRFVRSYTADIQRLIEATDQHISRYHALIGTTEGSRR